MGLFRSAGKRSRRKDKPESAPAGSPRERAIAWVKANRIPGEGIRPNHKATVATPEVTGYLIPSLRDAGETELAMEFVRWEASVQQPDGSVLGPGSDVPYTFDTAQVARGFLAMLDLMPELEGNLRRACDYTTSQIGPGGEVLTPSYDMWQLADGTYLSEYGNLYVLPPLLLAGEKLNEPRYVEAARLGMEYFRRKPDLVEWKPQIGTLSHYFGYMMEALVDLGETDLARKGLRQARAIQKKNGSIPAFPGVDWVCSTGIAQLAIAWYKLGEPEPADRAMAYLKGLQNDSGGFYGSYGWRAKYLPAEEISWGVKFFLDALLLSEKADSAGVEALAARLC
jgi:hypothetical protein